MKSYKNGSNGPYSLFSTASYQSKPPESYTTDVIKCFDEANNDRLKTSVLLQKARK